MRQPTSPSERVKGKDAGGSYSWDSQFHMLGEALTVFGKGNVSTHVIVGLGETEHEATEVIQRCVDMGCRLLFLRSRRSGNCA